MLACGARAFGLEITARCHYHSDLETSGRPDAPRNPLKNIVITTTKIAILAAALIVASAMSRAAAKYYSRLDGLETTEAG